MKTYSLNCKRDTKNIDPKMVRTKKNRLYVLVMSRTRFRVNPHSIVA